MRIATISAFLIAILSSQMLSGQDTNYWTQQFGTRSALLSGAVVAGTDDNSMVYYNPGALGFLEDGNISINANLYQLENITIENAIGQSADFKSSQVGNVPLLVSGMLNREKSKWKIGYGIMSPVAFQFKGTARLDDAYDFAEEDESPGLEDFIGEMTKSVRITEILGAIGFSRKLNDHFSIGFSNFLIFRNENFTRNFMASFFLNNDRNTLVSGTEIINLKYINVRYQLKAGIAWKVDDKWEIGATLTSPSVNLFGRGTIAENLTLNNTKLFSDDRRDLLASDRQVKLKSTFKSPLSFSVGINRHFNKSTISLTAEYFNGIDAYNIMQPEANPFVRPSDLYPDLTTEKFLTIESGASTVFNVALGYEYQISDVLTLLVGGRTDNSYFNAERTAATTISDWNLYHFSGGIIINKERSSLTLGLLGSTGSNDEYLQDGNLENPDENLILGGSLKFTKSRYTALGFLLGYTYRFRKFN
ncbi:MAG: hypothetical protein P8X57_08370 [Cyclobacteriaceae bacterium]